MSAWPGLARGLRDYPATEGAGEGVSRRPGIQIRIDISGVIARRSNEKTRP
jgi:hypothetical protein